MSRSIFPSNRGNQKMNKLCLASILLATMLCSILSIAESAEPLSGTRLTELKEVMAHNSALIKTARGIRNSTLIRGCLVVVSSHNDSDEDADAIVWPNVGNKTNIAARRLYFDPIVQALSVYRLTEPISDEGFPRSFPSLSKGDSLYTYGVNLKNELVSGVAKVGNFRAVSKHSKVDVMVSHASWKGGDGNGLSGLPLLKEVNGRFVPAAILQGSHWSTYISTLPDVMAIGMRQMINALVIAISTKDSTGKDDFTPKNIKQVFNYYAGLDWASKFLENVIRCNQQVGEADVEKRFIEGFEKVAAKVLFKNQREEAVASIRTILEQD